jgi:hypothetical protein
MPTRAQKLVVLMSGGDSIAPTCVITSTASEATAVPFTATFTFSEDVSGFELGDITVSANAGAGTFATVSASVYTAVITPTAAGTVTVAVAGNVCTDAAGNNNTASNTFSIVYVDGLFWIRSSSVVGLNDGEAVSLVDGLDAADRDVSQSDAAKKPLYKTNILNGKPGILFDNVNDCLQAAQVNLGAYTAATIYAVFTCAEGGLSMIMEFGPLYSSPGWVGLYRNVNGTVELVTTDDGSLFTGFTTTATITTTPKLATFTINKALTTNEVTGYVNGVSAGTRPSNTNTSLGFGNLVLNLGSRNNGASAPLNGYIFDVLFCGTVHDDTQRAAVEAYFNSQYALF